MVKITAVERIKKKEWKNWEPSQRLLEQIRHINIWIIGVTEEEKKKGSENVFEEIIVKNFVNIGKEIATPVQKSQSPTQDKSKEKHPKTHLSN